MLIGEKNPSSNWEIKVHLSFGFNKILYFKLKLILLYGDEILLNCFTETLRPPADMPEKAQMEQSEKEENRRQQRQKRQKLVQEAENLRVTFGSMRLTGKYERLVRSLLLNDKQIDSEISDWLP